MSHPLQGDAKKAARALNEAAATRKASDRDLKRHWARLRKFQVCGKAAWDALNNVTIERLDIQLVGGLLTSRFDRDRAAA